MSERSTRYSIISVITVSLEFYYTFLIFFMSAMLAWRQIGKAYVFRCLLYLFLKSVFLLYFFIVYRSLRRSLYILRLKTVEGIALIVLLLVLIIWDAGYFVYLLDLIYVILKIKTDYKTIIAK